MVSTIPKKGVKIMRLLNYKTIMVLFGCKRTTAYKLIEDINQRAVKDKKIELYIKGKVAVELISIYYGHNIDELIKINKKVNKKAPTTEGH